MTREQFQTLLRFFKTLGDESRLKIIGILATKECSVEELAALLDLKEPTVSHHLTKLKQLNLVTMRSEGNTHIYQLESENLQNISKEVFIPEKIASLVQDVDDSAWEEKVLKTYLEADSSNKNSTQRLKEIPQSRKKRLVVLQWLVKKFELGVNYPENTVDELLKLHYGDYKTLRNELVIQGFMQQENKMYRRTN
ncbi:MAG: metalloregulator ArsR/SmtB family transcription factor [Cyanobacteria bacterium P01_A01_bin.84]